MRDDETPWTEINKAQAKKNKAFFDRTRVEFYKKMSWTLPPEPKKETNENIKPL